MIAGGKVDLRSSSNKFTRLERAFPFVSNIYIHEAVRGTYSHHNRGKLIRWREQGEGSISQSNDSFVMIYPFIIQSYFFYKVSYVPTHFSQSWVIYTLFFKQIMFTKAHRASHACTHTQSNWQNQNWKEIHHRQC